MNNDNKYYVKVAYTTIIGYIDISINCLNSDFLPTLKDKTRIQIPILRNKNFEFIECCQFQGEEGNLLQNEEIPNLKSLYIKIIDDNECSICYETYSRQKPRILNQICGHECCRDCFNQIECCHICRCVATARPTGLALPRL